MLAWAAQIRNGTGAIAVALMLCASPRAQAEPAADHAASQPADPAPLSEAQQAVQQAFPDVYQPQVHPRQLHETGSAMFRDQTLGNAGTAQLDGGNLLRAKGGIPFPEPATGDEVLWNHRLRYRPAQCERRWRQTVVTAEGALPPRELIEIEHYHYAERPRDSTLVELMQWLVSPPALAGTGSLFVDTHEAADFARNSYQYARGDSSARAVPNLGYDSAALGSENLLFNDQLDGFFGPQDRYVWSLRGQRTLLVPANSDALWQALQREDAPSAMRAGLARYELRTVWVVDARLAPDAQHRAPRRRFYVDASGWQLRIVELYDAQDRLWRVQELHTVMNETQHYEMLVAQAVYDLLDGRYLVRSLLEENETRAGRFNAARLAARGRRFAASSP